MPLTRRWRSLRLSANWGSLALGLGLTAVAVGSLVGTEARNHGPLALVLIPGVLATVFLRRARPREALLVAAAVVAAMPDDRALTLPLMAVLYTIAARTAWREAAVAGGAAAALAIVAEAAWGSGSGRATDHGGLLGYAIGSVAMCAAAVAVGLYVGARRRVLEGLHERAERLGREQELLAERAVAQERVRIAQEIHDIVAHNVSLMVVKAQALGATVDGDHRVAEGTREIADLGRRAMSEMHATLRLLRTGETESPEFAPQPGLAQLEGLIEQLRGAGLELALTVEGRRRPLAQSVDLSAYRIVQEALTNVVKHAAGASTKVTIAYREGDVQLTIVNTEGEARATPRQSPADRHGLIGMRERASLFGGTLTTEARPNGFKVTATLPYGA
ncbi:MAG: sensor histidine kinase, partial [Solirubrobacteraceae bacterium]